MVSYSRVEGNSRSAPVGMPELSMRPTLAHAHKSPPLKQRDHFARPQDRDRPHRYAT